MEEGFVVGIYEGIKVEGLNDGVLVGGVDGLLDGVKLGVVVGLLLGTYRLKLIYFLLIGYYRHCLPIAEITSIGLYLKIIYLSSN